MKSLDGRNQSLGETRTNPFLHYVGWRVRRHPAVGETFFLTSPFIELIGSWPALAATNAATRTHFSRAGRLAQHEHRIFETCDPHGRWADYVIRTFCSTSCYGNTFLHGEE